MSRKQPVMSHDPLAGLAESATVNDTVSPREMSDNGRQPEESGAVIVLESTLTVAESAELHEALLGHMQALTPLVIDASEVEMIDTAGLQLLAATIKTASEKGVPVRIDAPSECLVGAARQIGLAGLLGLEDASQSA